MEKGVGFAGVVVEGGDEAFGFSTHGVHGGGVFEPSRGGSFQGGHVVIGAESELIIVEDGVGTHGEREEGGVAEAGLDEAIRPALVGGGVHEGTGAVVMSLDLVIGHAIVK